MSNRSTSHEASEHVTRAPKKMEVNINTLTGDGFSLRVSPYETVMSVKAKIQKQEGIPISQQHLVWRSVALEDDYTLSDYAITDGATLQLVLHLRGGPINTRRITYEDTVLREVAELVDGREDLFKKIFEGKDRSRPVTLLVYRDGDRLSLIEVVHREDGTITPLDRDRTPTPPLCDPVEEAAGIAEQMRENAAMRLKMKKLQASLSKNKQEKQRKLESEGVVAVPTSAEAVAHAASTASLGSTQPGTVTASASSLSEGPLTSKASSTSSFGGLKKGFLSSSGKPKEPPSATAGQAATHATPARTSKGDTAAEQPHHHHHDVITPAIASAAATSASATVVGVGASGDYHHDHVHREHHALLSTTPGSESSFGPIAGMGSRVRRVGSAGTVAPTALSRTPDERPAASVGRPHHSVASLVARPVTDAEEVRMHKSRRETMSARPARRNEVVSIDSLRRSTRSCVTGRTAAAQPGHPDGSGSSLSGTAVAKAKSAVSHANASTQASSSSVGAGAAGVRPRSAKRTSESVLPSLGTATARLVATSAAEAAVAAEASKSSGGADGFGPNKCHSCGKKLGLASNYPCRCGLAFCAKHRHAELHGCTYDYKSAGRRLLEESNPVVAASKLPKI